MKLKPLNAPAVREAVLNRSMIVFEAQVGLEEISLVDNTEEQLARLN